MLDETNNSGTPNHAHTKNLPTHDPTNQQESTNKNETTTEENNQMNTTVGGIDLSSLTPKNLFNVDNISEEQESNQSTMLNNQFN